MKEEKNILTMDEHGNISLPTDIGTTAMAEWEICGLFGVTAPTVRAGIKALCKSGIYVDLFHGKIGSKYGYYRINC